MFFFKLMLVHGSVPSLSVALIHGAFSNCSPASALSVHCRVSPILCVRGHRETVTRHLYIDQSFIPLQRPFFLFVFFACLLFSPVNTKLSVRCGCRLVAPSRLFRRFTPHRGDSTRDQGFFFFFFLFAHYTCRSSQ